MGHEYNEIKCFLSRAPLIHHGALITPLPPPQQGFCPTHFCACHFVSCMVFAQKLMQLVFAKRLLYFYSTKSTISNSRPLTKTKQNKTKVRIPTINISTLNNSNAIFLFTIKPRSNLSKPATNHRAEHFRPRNVPERAHWGCVFSTFHVLLVGVHSLFTCWL
jgi:hypothetical protein